MASHESYYTSIPTPASPTSSAAPPPPPPKPNSHDPSRTGTPIGSIPIPQSQQQPSGSYSIPSHTHSQSISGPPIPPHPPQPPSGPSSYIPQSPQTAQTFRPQSQTPTQQQQQQQANSSIQSVISPPPLNSSWLPPNLDSYNTSDLHSLLQNADLISAFAHQHPAYRSSLEPLQQAVGANLALAAQVMHTEKQVAQLRDQTAQLLLTHTSLQTQWRRKQSEMDDALSPWGPRAMYQRLVSSITEQEAVLRAVHESFLEGGGDGDDSNGGQNGKATEKEVTDWIKRIREGTTTLEKRREMRARWDEGRVGGWR